MFQKTKEISICDRPIKDSENADKGWRFSRAGGAGFGKAGAGRTFAPRGLFFATEPLTTSGLGRDPLAEGSHVARAEKSRNKAVAEMRLVAEAKMQEQSRESY